jgi:hypothetical protein
MGKYRVLMKSTAKRTTQPVFAQYLDLPSRVAFSCIVLKRSDSFGVRKPFNRWAGTRQMPSYLRVWWL